MAPLILNLSTRCSHHYRGSCQASIHHSSSTGVSCLCTHLTETWWICNTSWAVWWAEPWLMFSMATTSFTFTWWFSWMMHSTSAVACGMMIVQAWSDLIVSVTRHSIFNFLLHSYMWSRGQHTLPHCSFMWWLIGFDQFVTLTYLLTPWSRVLLEKLTGFQLIKKFPAFYGTHRFITAFTSARHLSLSCASSIQSIPPTSNFLKIHLNIILPSIFGSSKLSLSFKFPHQNPVYASPLTPIHAACPSPSHSRFDRPNNIWWGVRIIKLLFM